jgi:hypothetical protein
MRITDDRYSRDTARMDLAIRLIRLEARTRTIRRWTGLSDDRIRKLYRSYLRDSKASVRRHRGKSPQRSSVFLGTGRAARHATALASLLSAIGALPVPANKDRGGRPALSGDLVCDAYEAYCSLLPSREIGFEHAILLASALSSGRDLRLAGCRSCASPVLAEAVSLRLPVCERCTPRDDERLLRPGTAKLGHPASPPTWLLNANAPIRSPDPTLTGAPTSAKRPTGSSARAPTARRDS